MKEKENPQAASVHPIVIPRDLFEWLTEYAIELRGESSWKKDEPRRGYDQHYADLCRIVDTAVRFRDCRQVLLCDGCGRVYADDDQALSESCDDTSCGRFKQRMDWAKVVAG